MKHKGSDYKISAVKYHLSHKASLNKTCKIFNCKKSTLRRWILRYKNEDKNITRKNRKSISYKIYAPQTKIFEDRTTGRACLFEVLCEG